ncbi:hypothetical protein KIPB_012101, partial [Kipferlia bialata]|eukprot:g12101.t1
MTRAVLTSAPNPYTEGHEGKPLVNHVVGRSSEVTQDSQGMDARFSDIVVVVGKEKKEFKLHRIVLCHA